MLRTKNGICLYSGIWLKNLVLYIQHYRSSLTLKLIKPGMSRLYKINKWTQEMIQSEPQQVLNIKGKDRQIQLNRHKRNRRLAELATLPKKVETLLPKLKWISLTYISVKRKTSVSDTQQNVKQNSHKKMSRLGTVNNNQCVCVCVCVCVWEGGREGLS